MKKYTKEEIAAAKLTRKRARAMLSEGRKLLKTTYKVLMYGRRRFSTWERIEKRLARLEERVHKLEERVHKLAQRVPRKMK